MAIINNDSIEHVNGAIRAAARSECAKWGMDDWEDIAQEAFLRVWQMDKRGEFDEVGGASPAFYDRIKNYVRKAVNDERTEYMYFRGAFLYPRPAVEYILENLAWGGTPGTLNEAEAKVDVVASYNRMNENYRIALYKKYALGVQPERQSASRRTLYRAFDAFMHHLNFDATTREVSIEDITNE